VISKELKKKIRRIEITTNRLVNDIMAGQYVSAFKGRGMEFSEVREYLPGDDIRTIDWNVTARFNKPYVKRFVEERELTVFFLMDISGSQEFGSMDRLKSEIAAEICAILAFSAIKNNDQVGSILFSDSVESYLPPKKGSKHVLRVVRDILYQQPHGRGTDINAAMEFFSKVQKRRAVVFIVSDFMDSDYEKALRIANRRHDVVSIVIEDPRELELPAGGWIYMEDSETRQTACLDLSKKTTRQRFKKRIEEKTETFVSVYGKTIRTDQPYEADLYRFLKARARRMR